MTTKTRSIKGYWPGVAVLVLVVGALAFALAAILVFPAKGDAPKKAHRATADVALAVLRRVHVASPPAGTEETPEELDARLQSIATDSAAIGENDGATALLLAVSEHESAFALDVDKGPCRPGTCDGGAASCMMQIHGGSPERNAELFANRPECFRTALRALRNSRAACGKVLPEFQFAVYASGSCLSNAGKKGSQELYAAWQKWMKRFSEERARNPEGTVNSGG